MNRTGTETEEGSEVREAILTNSDLRSLVRIGEGYHLEFKRRVSSPARVAREAIAFANTWGGTILIGVGDDGALLGVKDVEEELYDVERATTLLSRPAITYTRRTVPVGPKHEVIVIDVPESRMKPHYLHEDSSTEREAFIRIEDQTVAASREVIALMASERDTNGVRFEFGDKELQLLRFLEEYHRITVAQYARLADIPRHVASTILVLLTRAKILRVQPGENEDIFVFRYHQGPPPVHGNGSTTGRKGINRHT